MQKGEKGRQRELVDPKPKKKKKKELTHTSRGDEHSDDQAVDGNDTGHDHGDDGLHDELRAHDGHGGDTDSTLGGSVSGTEACFWEEKGGKSLRMNCQRKTRKWKRKWADRLGGN